MSLRNLKIQHGPTTHVIPSIAEDTDGHDLKQRLQRDFGIQGIQELYCPDMESALDEDDTLEDFDLGDGDLIIAYTTVST